MVAKTRGEREFQAVYSMHLEALTASYYRRIDKILTFGQFFLGAAVFSDLLPDALLGAIIVALATVQLVWAPSASATTASSSYDRWHSLINRMTTLNDAALQEEIVEISERDSRAATRRLALAAYHATCVQLGCTITTDLPKPNVVERIVTALAGGRLYDS